MPIVRYNNEEITDPQKVGRVLGEFGVPYERWGTRSMANPTDEAVLKEYEQEITTLKDTRGYVQADLIALSPKTENLNQILAKFNKEHHHSEDEVRFVVDGAGVFEIAVDDGGLPEADERRLRFTAEAGDLIVIPANRRHLFYLTEQSAIRCIRLFKTTDGWEAIYDAGTVN